jgi:hypothetical protein
MLDLTHNEPMLRRTSGTPPEKIKAVDTEVCTPHILIG